ncbi:MAG: MFS transporter [Planctomycetes bacterium]|nr:MFS transporter [Planctomycetota bacterium]
MGSQRVVFATAFLRALATGGTGVLLGFYLSALRLSPAEVGLVVGAGLAGAAAALLAVTLAGERLGRRRTLILLAAISGAGGLAAAVGSSPAVLAACAFAGMLNGMGRDRGGALALEQAILASSARAEERTRALAWYNVIQDAGHALGSILAAAPTLLRQAAGLEEVASLRAAMAGLAVLSAAPLPLYLLLPASVEATRGAAAARVSPESRRMLSRICALFGLDSLAGGFLTTAMLSLYFHERFGADEGTVGLLFLGARGLNAASHLAAAWLARRIGLVNTMVFTHIPSSLLLVTVVFAPSFPVAAVLFLLREGLVEMDVPTRQSYVLAVVRPEERVAASGATNLVRLGAWAAAPALAGAVLGGASGAVPFLLGAGMKIAYDLLLWKSFRRTKPPEEG